MDLNAFQLKLQIQVLLFQLQVLIQLLQNNMFVHLNTTKVFQAALELKKLGTDILVMLQLHGLSASNKEDHLGATVIQH